MLTALIIVFAYLFGMGTVIAARRKIWFFRKVDYVEIEELTNIHKKLNFINHGNTYYKYTTLDIHDGGRIEIRRCLINGESVVSKSIEELTEDLDKACLKKQKELEGRLEQGQNLLI